MARPHTGKVGALAKLVGSGIDRGLAELPPGVADRQVVFFRGLPVAFDVELVTVVAELLHAPIVICGGRSSLRSLVGQG